MSGVQTKKMQAMTGCYAKQSSRMATVLRAKHGTNYLEGQRTRDANNEPESTKWQSIGSRANLYSGRIKHVNQPNTPDRM